MTAQTETQMTKQPYQSHLREDMELGPFAYNLTDEQQAEIEEPHDDS